MKCMKWLIIPQISANKLQLIVGKGNEYGFISNFDLPQPFTSAQNGVTAQNGEQPIRPPNGLLCPRVELEQRTQSGDEIVLGAYPSKDRIKNLVIHSFFY